MSAFECTSQHLSLIRDKALIGDDMGLGKTMEALLALPKGASAVVVCPAMLKRKWANETKRWRPDLEPVVCYGRKGWSTPRPGTVTIINYDILPPFLEPQGSGHKARAVLPEAEARALAGAVVIFDEVQTVKNYKAMRSKKCAQLAQAAGAVWA